MALCNSLAYLYYGKMIDNKLAYFREVSCRSLVDSVFAC